MNDNNADSPEGHLMPDVVAHHGLLKDTRLHVDDTGGAGRPVLLIHPWPLSGQAWSAQAPVLHDAGYRVITYDRRGFGRSDKPLTGYTFNTLTEDLQRLIDALDLDGVTLVGSSMGGGEVARYVSSYGTERLHSVVFASSVTPYMLQTGDNPDGPLTGEYAAQASASFIKDQDAFYDDHINEFFSADGELMVSESVRCEALALCMQADEEASLACMAAWASTDFRDDLTRVSVPALVIHGDADASVPFEGSARRTHDAIPGSELYVIAGGPHGCNISHPDEFNEALLDFLAR
jgi:non-heme chloroperoxidase